jgi:hypothetical protein
MSLARAVGGLSSGSAAPPPRDAQPAPAARRWRLVRRAAAGLAVAAGLALGLTSVPPAKRRALLAGGATGLVGAASVVLAGIAAGIHRRRRQ